LRDIHYDYVITSEQLMCSPYVLQRVGYCGKKQVV